MALELARDRIRASLLAGAMGDALGAPVEFMDIDAIERQCGPRGVTGYLPGYGRDGGAITDDTQMTLFTAEGLIRATVRMSVQGLADVPSVVWGAYQRWLATQGVFPSPALDEPSGPSGWLVDVPGLHSRRAPGITCLSALESGHMGGTASSINNSKGCGGVMRVAPVGLVAQEPFDLAVDVAALTHGHPSGYLAAGVHAGLVAALVEGASLDDGLDVALADLDGRPDAGEVRDAVVAARSLAVRGRPTPRELESLGGGWVAEEALAISVCAALAADDLRDGLLLAVNHSGDSDSTGAIAGNILGTMLGEAALPEDLLADLELRDVIETVADDLADAFHGEGVSGDQEGRFLERYPGF